MKIFRLAVIALSIISLGNSCKNNKTKETKTGTNDSIGVNTTTSATTYDVLNPGELRMKAKFVSFELSDITHYIFADESGKMWDFKDLSDSTYKFAVEIPAKETSTENQGWGSNKEFIGKWFNVTYKNTMDLMYPGQGMDSMLVITHVSPAQ